MLVEMDKLKHIRVLSRNDLTLNCQFNYRRQSDPFMCFPILKVKETMTTSPNKVHWINGY